MHKIAKNSAEAWDIQDNQSGKPHCWIQWKGTKVCMDFTCVCGDGFHIDAEFSYNIKCSTCGRVYFCNGHIELIELQDSTGAGTVVLAESD